MNEKDPLRPLLHEYRDHLRQAGPSPDVQDRLRMAMRQQRRARLFTLPRAWAAAAAFVLVGSVAWWRTRPLPPAPHVSEPVREYAVATPPPASVSPAPMAAPRLKRPLAPPPKAPAPAPTAAAPPAEAITEALTLSAETEAMPVAPIAAEAGVAKSRDESRDLAHVSSRITGGLRFRLRTTMRTMPGKSVVPINMLAPPAASVVSNLAPPTTAAEPLGERVILGYRCEGTRQKNGAVTVERWHAPVLGIDLLTKITDANGRETINEVVEVTKDK